MLQAALAVVTLLALPALAFAQQPGQPNPDAAAAGCMACGGGLMVVVMAMFVLNVALLVWVARDAKSRGMDSAVVWMLLVFFLGLLGLIVYVFSRPQGNTVQCSHCGNKRLQASAKCPHCGNA